MCVSDDNWNNFKWILDFVNHLRNECALGMKFYLTTKKAKNIKDVKTGLGIYKCISVIFSSQYMAQFYFDYWLLGDFDR